VPSGWTTSGIDWDNLRSNRTEDIVYHLHKATYERFFYYYRSSAGRANAPTNPSVPPSIKNYRVRTENAMFEIRSLLRRIYAVDEEYVIDGGAFDYFAGTRCVFKKDYTPTHTPLFNYYFAADPANPRYGNNSRIYFKDYLGGLKPLDVSSGGDLEDIAGGDLDFLRDLSINRRINIQDLTKIYNILITPQDCLADTTRRLTVGADVAYTSDSGLNFNTPTAFLNPFSEVIMGEGNNPSNVNTAISNMYSDPAQDLDPNPGFGGNWSSIRYQYNSNAIGQQRRNVSFLGGYLQALVDSSTININDINVNYYTVDLPVNPSPSSSLSDYNEFPLSVYGNNGAWLKRSDSFNNKNSSNKDYHFLATGKINSGIPILTTDPNYDEEICETHIRTINIDSVPGLLEYYTEP